MKQIKGLIRSNDDILKVYSQQTDLVDCYHDTYSDTYCIPNITTEWLTKQAISNLGFKFVDGTETLYIGNSHTDIVVDSDPTD